MGFETKPNGSIVVTVRITLVPGKDDDLIALFRGAENRCRAEVVRNTMRSGLSSPIESILGEECENEEILVDMSSLGFDL